MLLDLAALQKTALQNNGKKPALVHSPGVLAPPFNLSRSAGPLGPQGCKSPNQRSIIAVYVSTVMVGSLLAPVIFTVKVVEAVSPLKSVTVTVYASDSSAPSKSASIALSLGVITYDRSLELMVNVV